MLARSRATLAILALCSALVLAGCTSSDEAPAPKVPDAADQPKAPNAPAPGQGSAAPPPPAAAPKPQPRPEPTKVEDAGSIEGVFEKRWDVNVANVAFRTMNVDFVLSGAQAGAPPTARVHFGLYDPEGNLIKSALVGLGGSDNALHWSLTNADIKTPGVYTLKATTSDGDAGTLPSAGFAKYSLAAAVEY